MAAIVDARKRRRRGWIVDYRDADGKRHWISCTTKQEAERVFSKVVPLQEQAIAASNHALDITFGAFTKIYMRRFSTVAKKRTTDVYDLNLRLHLLPTFGGIPVRKINRSMVMDFITGKTELSKGSKRLVIAVLRAVLSEARKDHVLQYNPAAEVIRDLKLSETPRARRARIGQQAYTPEQLAKLLEVCAASVEDARYYPLFFTLSRTGMRLGEGIALQWDDCDFTTRRISIARSLSKGVLDTPKSGVLRVIDMSAELAEFLKKLQVQRRQEALQRGGEVPAWVFPSAGLQPVDASKVTKALRRLVRAAGLPKGFSSKGFRHSLGSILTARGVSPAYIQSTLGHADIATTIGVYGSGLEHTSRSVDVMDALLRQPAPSAPAPLRRVRPLRPARRKTA